jgi:phosphoribosyl 1,2-cyclic phosphodiesterase
MRLRFLGTRGELTIRSRRHRRHTATLVEWGAGRILIDAGRDWTGRLTGLSPHAIVLTHAHADHAEALRQGSACPVYATAATWRSIGGWPIRDRRRVGLRAAFDILGVRFEAVPVAHSVRAPAVGYRITAGRRTIFYVPDVAGLVEAGRALDGVEVYVGDGAALSRPILRHRDGALTGHASIAMQLDWCRDRGIRRALFTHCGSAIVRSAHADVERRVRALGGARGIEAGIASDGDVLVLDVSRAGHRDGGASRRPKL